ncbi:MAG TPA: ABC transporter permease [Candidatus Dormibacteraeota bacterium]|nr:ABC transporter permease [Candidatus Dormibacteraeota bacterium]
MGPLLDATDPWIRWDWFWLHVPVFEARLLEHVELTAIAVVVGIVIAAPMAIVAYRWRPLRDPLLAIGGLLYTIPSLALFAFLIPFTGLTVLTSEIGLVSYTLLILLRNMVVGLEGVPEEVRDAARGMGYRPLAMLLRVEIPLATPAILAGIRIATVTTIGLVTVTALIGEGGLGQLINEGLIEDFKTPLVVGTVLSIVLALVADLGLAGVERLLTPWARRSL